MEACKIEKEKRYVGNLVISRMCAYLSGIRADVDAETLSERIVRFYVRSNKSLADSYANTERGLGAEM